jgi:hypothetical protein
VQTVGRQCLVVVHASEFGVLAALVVDSGNSARRLERRLEGLATQRSEA